MRTVAICSTRDEDDLLEAFVRHTLALVDVLVVVDHGSTDHTPQVLSELEREGLALEVHHAASLGHAQGARTTRLLHHASREYQPDWVFALDTDEFLVPTDTDPPGWVGAAALEDPRSPLALDWYTWLVAADDDAAEPNPALRLRHRLPARSGTFRKVVVPGALAREPGAALAQGSHVFLLRNAAVTARPVDGALAHFPLRTPGQLAARVVLHRLQYLAMADAHPDWGVQYVASFEQLCADPTAFLRGFPEAARWYAAVGAPPGVPERSPFRALGGPLRWTPPVAGSVERAVSLTLAYAAQLARSHGAGEAHARVLENRLAALEGQVATQQAELLALRDSTPVRLARMVHQAFPLGALRGPLRQALDWLERRGKG